jgi:chromodomain-helicase-DNA-binding protein 4
MTLSIKKRRATLSISSSRSIKSSGTEVVPDSQEEDGVDSPNQENGDSSDDEDDEDDARVAKRRSGRSLTNQKKELPFSPKKTRSRRVYVIESDDDLGGDDTIHTQPTRRSTRSKKGVKVNLDAETYLDGTDSSEEDSDDYESRNRKKTKEGGEKIIRAKVPRPAYGRFRAVADLDYDSDEETAALREHRGICEKCHRGPAHQLINAFLKKPKNKGKRRKKTSEDEFDEPVDEEEKFNALGGWVRWYVIINWLWL